MAKVTGPLMSMSASGSVAKSIVFSIWKGQAYVRQWLKPSNPEDPGQGDQRIMMGGTGRACGKVAVTSPYNVKLGLKSVIPAGQSKQSYLVKYILDHYLTNPTAYTAELALLTAAAGKTSFDVGAGTLGITSFDLDYATVAAYRVGLGVYLLYKTAQALGFTGTAYTPTVATMTNTKVHTFITKLKSV